MRHRVDTFKIGRTSAHRTAMLANMVCSLFESPNGQIETTVVKAKACRRLAEKMITLGKKGGLHCRRLAISNLRNKDVVKKIFEEIAPRYAGRNGGYTRIIKLAQRIGDNAQVCLLQLVETAASSAAPAEPETKAAE